MEKIKARIWMKLIDIANFMQRYQHLKVSLFITKVAMKISPNEYFPESILRVETGIGTFIHYKKQGRK